jgi:hypothetical protein
MHARLRRGLGALRLAFVVVSHVRPWSSKRGSVILVPAFSQRGVVIVTALVGGDYRRPKEKATPSRGMVFWPFL